MKKFLKVLYFAVIILIALFLYNYLTGNSLFDFNLDFIGVPSYQEEVITAYDTENENTVAFEKLYYSQLDEDEKKIYDKVYFAIKDHKDSVKIYQKVDSSDLFNIVGFVLAENPELFWTNGACSVDSRGRLTFEYIYTAEEAEALQKQIDESTRDIIAKANAVSGEYEKALMLFDYITQTTAYNDNAVENLSAYPYVSNISGPFLYHSAVCSGYSKAYQYLLSKCGLNAETVYGTATTSDGNVDHAWTLQYLEGNYYYTDVTWSDSFENTDLSENVSHVYFCLTGDEMLKTHTLENKVTYPECTAKKANYFVKEGLYFTSYNKSEIHKSIKSQFEKENYFIQLKFENAEDYRKATESLIKNGGIYPILLELDPFAKHIRNDTLLYSEGDDENVLTLIFDKKN